MGVVRVSYCCLCVCMAKFCLTYDEFESCAKEFIAVSSKLKDGWRERAVRVASNPGKETVFLVKTVSLLLDDDEQMEDSERDHQSIEEQMESIEEEDDPAVMNSSAPSCISPSSSQNIACETTTDSRHNLQQTSIDSTHKPPPLSVHVEYHIVHSFSYKVPVLYFNTTYSNGRQLSLDDTWKLLSKRFVSGSVDRWGLISQQEHPLLHRPFYHIHPCHTANVMAQATDTKKNEAEKCRKDLTDMRTLSGGEATVSMVPHLAAGSERKANYLVTWLSTFGPLVGLTLPLHYGRS